MGCAASAVAGTPLLLWQAIELQVLLEKRSAILSAQGFDAGGSALGGDGGSSADTGPWMWYWSDQASCVADRSGRCRLTCKQPRHMSICETHERDNKNLALCEYPGTLLKLCENSVKTLWKLC